jgi:hypothetical protein
VNVNYAIEVAQIFQKNVGATTNSRGQKGDMKEVA